MKYTYKKYIRNSVLLLTGIVLLTTSSCKKKLEDEFLNPDGFTDPTVEGFLTNLQTTLGIFRYDYGEMYHTYTTFNPMLGSGGYINPGSATEFSWGTNPYTNTYSRVKNIRYMEDFYAKLTDEQKPDYDVFLWAGKVIKAYLFAFQTDIYNSVPYFEAMQALDGNFFPKFDSQEAIYNDLLDQLKDVATKLKNYQLNTSFAHQAFRTQDVWFQGDVAKWRVLINSLRIRFAMRLTNVKPDMAKSILQEVIADGQYAKDRATSITHVDKQPERALEFLIFRSMQERRAFLWMPDNMLKVLRKPGFPDDPRIKVLFQPDKDGNYTSMPTEGPDVTAISSQITSTDLSKTFPSIYNRTTFEANYGLPYQLITSSEISLILAEAAVRWPDLGIVGVDEYKKAIQQSIDIYYETNALNNSSFTGQIPAAKPAKPSQTEIDAFLLAMTTEYTAATDAEKKGLIYDQKYIHFNMMKPYELWADTRRLFKELGARVIKSPSNVKLMERMIYPGSEELNNAQNFLAVKAQNNYTSPVWWTGR